MTSKYMWIWCLTLMLALSACQKKEEKAHITNEKAQTSATEALKAIDRNLGGVAQPLRANQVSFETVVFDYKLPDGVQHSCQNTPNPDVDFCPKISVQLAKIKPLWIESIVNRHITNDDNHERYLKFTQTLDDKLALKMADESLMVYRLSVLPVHLPIYDNIAQFAVERQEVHGERVLNVINYLLFDMDYQSQIDFDDVVRDGQQEALLVLLEQAFERYLVHTFDFNKKQLATHQKKYPLMLSQDIYFASDALVFVYAPGVLADIEQGFVKLMVPYDDLQTVIKPRYLPKTPS